jgi:hypothetical protein
MPEQHLAVRTALQWLEAAGPRTKGRFAGLVRHYGELYGLSKQQIDCLIEEGWEDAGARCEAMGRSEGGADGG